MGKVSSQQSTFTYKETMRIYITKSELAKKMGVSRFVINRLQKKGHIIELLDKNDKRRGYLYIVTAIKDLVTNL